MREVAAPDAETPGYRRVTEERAGALWTWRTPSCHPGPAAVFDLDGVLSDGSARNHYLRGPNPDWESFLAGVGEDPVIEEVASLLALLAPSLAVVLLTGRPARVHDVTVDWLVRHQLRWDLLVMRRDGDYRPASHFKQDAVRALKNEGFEVKLCFEDDKRTVETLRRAGLPTMYVHSGYYD